MRCTVIAIPEASHLLDQTMTIDRQVGDHVLGEEKLVVKAALKVGINAIPSLIQAIFVRIQKTDLGVAVHRFNHAVKCLLCQDIVRIEECDPFPCGYGQTRMTRGGASS